jgi:hypothetical protein
MPARSLYKKMGFKTIGKFVEGGKEEIFCLEI